MKILKEYSGLVALVILAIMSVSNLAGGKSALFGTAIDCQAVTCFTTVGILTSLQVDGTTILNTVTLGATTVASLVVTGDVTVNGGTETITTTNTATSTLAVGCIQGVATSTATPIKQMLFATSTTIINGVTVSTSFGGGTMAGIMLWGYGTCPSL